MKIVADINIPFINEYFAECGDLILKSGRAISPDDVKDADILLVRSITPVNQTLLENSSVKFVGSITAGADHLDVEWLNKANIIWQIAAGFNAPPVADYVVSVIAALQQQGLLQQPNKKAAVIGVGNVGRLVVKHLQLLGFEILPVDPLRAEQEKDFISLPFADIQDVDLISLHVPLTKSGKYPTYQLIDKTFLQKQKKGCVLLNASRGAVIHAEDLKKFGTHCHWCFDVWPNEPHLDKEILAKALIATPHIAGYAVQSKIRGIEMIYRALCNTELIKAKSISPIIMPQQKLTIANQCWQEIVLNIFNPLVFTQQLREVLIDSIAQKFDDLRNRFNDRHEFAFTSIQENLFNQDNKHVLHQLGITTFSSR